MTKYLFFSLALLLSCHTLVAQQGEPVAPGVYAGPNLHNDNDLVMDVSEPDESGNQNVIVLEYGDDDQVLRTLIGELASDGSFQFFIVGNTWVYEGTLHGFENSGAAYLSTWAMSNSLMIPVP